MAFISPQECRFSRSYQSISHQYSQKEWAASIYTVKGFGPGFISLMTLGFVVPGTQVPQLCEAILIQLTGNKYKQLGLLNNSPAQTCVFFHGCHYDLLILEKDSSD